jgi:hypothetical protein
VLAAFIGVVVLDVLPRLNTKNAGEGSVHPAPIELTIGSTTFYVRGPSVLAAFAEGVSYRVYYAAGHGRAMNQLLSVEPL